jgi:hypothetical protein
LLIFLVFNVIVYTAAYATVVIKLIIAKAKQIYPFQFKIIAKLSSVLDSCQIASSATPSPNGLGFKANIAMEIAIKRTVATISKMLETLTAFFN